MNGILKYGTCLLTKLGFLRKKQLTNSNLTFSRNLRFEYCEDRRMLAPILVNDPGDFTDNNTSVTTLREAIIQANQQNGPDEIVISNSFAGQNINILLGNLVVTERVTITGPTDGYVFINDASPTADTGLTFSGFDLNPTGVFGDTSVSGLVIDGYSLAA